MRSAVATELHDEAFWHCRIRIDKFAASDIRDAGLHERQATFWTPGGGRVATVPYDPTGPEMLAAGLEPVAIVEAEHNVLCNAGIGLLLQLLTTTGTPTAYSAANARIAAGDGNGSVPTAAATDAGLAATTNQWYQGMDGGFPSVSAQTATWQGTVATGNGNFTWNEFGLDNGGASSASPAGTLLNHRGLALGTKTSTYAWQTQVQITIS